MPILQSRMLDLIHAADAYKQLFAAYSSEVEKLMEDIASGAIERLAGPMRLQLLKRDFQPPEECVETIVKEKEHFRHCAARNNYAARKIAAKRRATQPASQPSTEGELQQKPSPFVAKPFVPFQPATSSDDAMRAAIERELAGPEPLPIKELPEGEDVL